MRLLLDNTLIHRVGGVLASEPTQGIRSVDALAVFHLAEHILFSKDIVISNFEPNDTFERTAAVVALLQEEGIAPISIESFSADEYEDACSMAAFRALDELTAINGEELESIGHIADDSTRPTGIQISPFDKWASPEYMPRTDPEEVRRLVEMRAPGSFELMIVKCPPLLGRLRLIRAVSGNFTRKQEAALTTLMRIEINQELAVKRNAVYSPAPQRARVSQRSTELFRHSLEKIIQSSAEDVRPMRRSRVLQEMTTVDRLPLPLFAFHALRNIRVSSPRALLEAARKARDGSEVVAVRDWLSRWEAELASEDCTKRNTAIDELKRREQDLSLKLSGQSPTLFSSLQLGGTLKLDSTGSPNWQLPSPTSILGALYQGIARRFDRQRQLLAVLSSEFLADTDMGSRILAQLNRWISDS